MSGVDSECNIGAKVGDTDLRKIPGKLKFPTFGYQTSMHHNRVDPNIAFIKI